MDARLSSMSRGALFADLGTRSSAGVCEEGQGERCAMVVLVRKEGGDFNKTGPLGENVGKPGEKGKRTERNTSPLTSGHLEDLKKSGTGQGRLSNREYGEGRKDRTYVVSAAREPKKMGL